MYGNCSNTASFFIHLESSNLTFFYLLLFSQLFYKKQTKALKQRS